LCPCLDCCSIKKDEPQLCGVGVESDMTMNSSQTHDSERYITVHDGGDSTDLDGNTRSLDHIRQRGDLDHHDRNQSIVERMALLDNAPIAPIVRMMSTARTTCKAPFDKTERKKAHTSAVYYSECFLHGIEPIMADTAAEEAQGKYDKWWIASTASSHQPIRIGSISKTGDHDRNLDGVEGLERTSHKRLLTKTIGGEVVSGKRRIKSGMTPALETTSMSTSTIAGQIMNDISEEEKMAVASTNALSNVSSSLYAQDERADTGGAHVSADDDDSMDDGPEVAFDGQNPSHGGIYSRLDRITTLPISTASYAEDAKVMMIEDLRSSGGSVETPQFLKCLEILQTRYAQQNLSDQRSSHTYVTELEGNWLTLSKPTYTEVMGKNEKGESLYSLGRISFDMFRPAGLICSVQASFNNVESIDPKNPGRPLHVPKKLMKDIWSGECTLQTYE
jgi:hypothetical protein